MTVCRLLAALQATEGQLAVTASTEVALPAHDQRMPARVQRVMVRMFEGVGKSALAMVGVAGDAGMGLIPGLDTTTGRLLSVDQLLAQIES